MKALANEHWIIGPLDNEMYQFSMEQGWPTLPYDVVQSLVAGHPELNIPGTQMGQAGTSRYIKFTHLNIAPAVAILERGFDVVQFPQRQWLCNHYSGLPDYVGGCNCHRGQ